MWGSQEASALFPPNPAFAPVDVTPTLTELFFDSYVFFPASNFTSFSALIFVSPKDVKSLPTTFTFPPDSIFISPIEVKLLPLEVLLFVSSVDEVNPMTL